MKNLHYGHCLIGVGLAVVLLVALGVQASTLGVLAVALACPLMMLVMMKSMMGGSSPSSHSDDHPADQGHTR
jgi:choline-glycine betaine transporter